ncbi:MAG TPA: ester cyclase [Chlamydiales bacterium]|nr:ester cyclase [Chlamydiales bacterium]
MSEKNIKIIKNWLEGLIDQPDLANYDDNILEDVVIHGPASGQVTRGLAALKKLDASYNKVYPNKKFFIEEIFSYGDKVYVQWVVKGTHEGKVKGIQPKKKVFSIAGFSVYRFSKGKISEIWQFWDRLGILEQLGDVHVRPDPVEPAYSSEILKNLGMDVYFNKAALLSKRERECLTHLIQGKTAKETAALLKLSPRTVESYFENIKEKLKCSHKGDLFTTAQILEKLELL